MAMTWAEIMNSVSTMEPQKLMEEWDKMLKEKGMTMGQFMATEEYQTMAKKCAEYRFTSPDPFMPSEKK